MNTKKTLIFIAVVVVLGVLYFIFSPKPSLEETETTAYTSEVYAFVAEEGGFNVQYNDDGSRAELTYDGHKYELERAVAASGAKYESADGLVMFWEHQGEAMFEINGEDVFTEPAKLTCNDMDQDCTGPDEQVARPGDPIPGIDITTSQAGAIDDDSDGDSFEDIDETNTDKGEVATLVNHTWVWRGTTNTGGEIVSEPQKANAFTLMFTKDDRVSATTDCNNAMGSYTVTGSALTFGPLASTLMACPDSQETEFISMLETVEGFSMTNGGQTTLELQLKNGNTMMLVAIPAGVVLNHDKIVGLTEAEAIVYAKEQNVPFRVIKRDGETLPATMDYRVGRINAEVEEGVVIGYAIEL